MNLIDRGTVENLELRAPGSSSDDRDEILMALDRNIIFSKASDEAKIMIRESLITTYDLIPSLYTFLEDVKFIRPCAKLLKSLNDQPLKGSLRSMLRQLYVSPDPRSVIIQYSEQHYQKHPTSLNNEDLFLLAYQQLWFFTIRRFPFLGTEVTKKEKHRPKPITLEPSDANRAVH